MFLKNSLLLCALLFFCTNFVFAQTPLSNLTAEEKIEMQENFKAMVDALELSEEQKPEFISISKKYGNQLLDLKNSDAYKMTKYRKMKAIVESRNQEMENLLSQEQYKMYLEKQEQLHKKRSSKN